MPRSREERLFLYENRKSKGLCVHCGVRHIGSESDVLCDEDFAARKGRDSARVERAKTLGNCVDCGLADNPAVVGKLRCASCLDRNKLSAKVRREKLIAAGKCVRCMKVAPVVGNQRCLACVKVGQAHRVSYKMKAFSAYGGNFCACCGETDLHFLSIDHIDGGGGKHRKELKNDGDRLYKWLERNAYPPGFRVLCMNCNASRGWWGFCPHEFEQKYTVSSSGEKVSVLTGQKDVWAIASALGKICRFSGNSKRFWSVLQHSFVTSDLVSEEHKIYALLHDCVEAAMGDTPTPFKLAQTRHTEHLIFLKTLDNLGVPAPSEETMKLIKVADEEALLGEVWEIGPNSLKEVFSGRSAAAEKLVRKYVKKYPPEQCISSDGLAVLAFVRAVEKYLHPLAQAA